MSLSISVALIFFSCKKASDERNEANKPPVAIAWLDQEITLPTDSISLDGSSSHDPGIHTRHVCEVGSTQGQKIAQNILDKVNFLKD